MRVAVYSGSFDPLHIGHLAILRHLCGCGNFDMVYLLVSPQNPLKDASKAHSARERFEAAVAAVERHPELRVRVDDIEMGMPLPSYTINTLEALAAREPENSFTLVMGADSLSNIRRWRSYDRILSEFGVAAFPREGYDLPALKESLMQECADFRIDLVDAPLVTVSSSEIREGLAAGRDVSALLM